MHAKVRREVTAGCSPCAGVLCAASLAWARAPIRHSNGASDSYVTVRPYVRWRTHPRTRPPCAHSVAQRLGAANSKGVGRPCWW